MVKSVKEGLVLALIGLVLTGCPYALKVTIEPPEAVAAGAQWQVDNGPLQVSDATVPDLTEGPHTVSFTDVPGWTTPADQQVIVSAENGAYAKGVYQQVTTTGTVTVVITPQGAIDAGAQFQIDGLWQNSGAVVTLNAGDYTVSFKPIAGWTTPADQQVAVGAGAAKNLSASYVAVEVKGSLQTILAPDGAIAAGAQWQVDGGPLNNSGVTVQGLSAGAHVISFKEVPGWSRPADKTVTIVANQMLMAKGRYMAIVTTGSLTVTLLPSEAAAAGAMWQVDGGALQASGAVVSGLSVGTHAVTFADVTGWIAPAAQSVTIAAGANTAAQGVYTAQVLTGSHAGRFTKYEGSKTCLRCHPNEVRDMHSSVHYQWKGDSPYVTNLESGGKVGNINDFCTYPDISWISQMTNVDGKVVDGGCAQCHVGMGAKPLLETTQSQLENIDCLLCHSDTYKRKVEKVGDVFKFVPAPEKMTVSELQAVTDIHKPTNDACLNCHSSSGGGNNNKRGDLSEGHRNPSPLLDVHLASRASGGAGLLCTDCHVTEAHHIAGRGVDLRPTDLDVDISCATCHTSKPHHNTELDSHTKRVDCATCHIPRFAKLTSTDMLRDFSAPADLLVDKRLYEPHIEREANVIPEYRFFDGYSQFYRFGDPVTLGDDGYVEMAGPAPAVAGTPGAKIAPMKHHKGVMAVDLESQALIPLKMGLLFQTGDVDMAIRRGASDVGWPLNKGYGFVDVERHMGLYHEVQPKEQALTCNDCHYGATRMDFDALGYQRKTTRNNRPLCASCHEDESHEWRPADLFKKVHEKHVKDKRIDCIECHYFRN